MHAGWRLFIKFIRVASICLHGGARLDWILDDPPVKAFNSHLFFLWKLVRACSIYVNLILNTPGAIGLDLFDSFRDSVTRNIDFAWVFHFLYDFGYLVLDFKQSVRSGESQHLDLLWREFFALGHCSTANKTQYVPMAIMRVWWSRALNPRVAALYHSIRSIPMSAGEGCMVGWDYPCEALNLHLTLDVQHATLPAIEKSIQRYPFISHSHSQLHHAFMGHRAEHARHLKDMEADVQILVQWLIDGVGGDWRTATAPRTVSALGISARGAPPWDEMHTTMTRAGNDSVPAFVARHVRNLTSGFYVFGR